MARVKPSIVTLTGKIGDTVLTKGKNGQRARKAPEKGKKKNETALQKQNNRTKFLNRLAGELNTVMHLYAKDFKSKHFYQTLNKHFRKEPLDNRWFLLKKIEQLEVNPDYALTRFCIPEIETVQSKGRIDFHFSPKAHLQEQNKSDCYCYEFLLMAWNKTNRHPHIELKPGAWIYHDESTLPKFIYDFKIPPSTVHWVLFFGVQLGQNGEELGLLATTAMRVELVGTYDKTDLELMEERKKNESVKRKKYNEKSFLKRVQPLGSE